MERIEQEIHFCTTADGVRIAYATAGQGPPLVKAANWLNHLEFDWHSPIWHHFLEEFTRDHLFVRYDERGNGLSDWNVSELSFEAFVDDLEAVVDALGLTRFPILGISQGGPVAIAYAVRHPERVSHLILYGSYAKGWAKRSTPEQKELRQAQVTLIKLGWGQDNPAFRQMWSTLYLPEATPEQWQWFNDLQKVSASPENASRLLDELGKIDVAHLLPEVKAPTLVLHCRDDAAVPFEAGRLLASSIPGARFIPLESRNHLLLESDPAWPRFVSEVRRFLGSSAPPISVKPAAPHVSDPKAKQLIVGDSLGRYTIKSLLGVGGMGEVYLAEDTQLRRSVALKVLPSDLAANEDRMRRFVQEAQAAAALNHPNIAHVYEIGESDGVNFIAMEFVDGQTLRELIHGKQTDLAKLLRYLQHVAEGLAKAHAAGIVHRDLKPDNIMITHDGYAKILDFGLAKLIEPTGQKPYGEEGFSEAATALLQQHSTPGVILGTVGYMSPEQAQGKTKEIDHRSDIFSFGCILFEAVTGHKAFAGTDAIDTLNKIIREHTAPISDFRPDAPNHLQRIVRRCLAKDREDRYQTIKDVAIELRELRRDMGGSAGIDTTAPPPSAADSTPGSRMSGGSVSSGATQPTPSSSAEYIVTGLKRHKVAVAIALIVLTIGAVGFGIYLHARNSEVAIESIAVLPFQNRSPEADTEYLSDGLAESLIYRLSQLPHLKVSPTTSVFHYKGKGIDPVKVGQELGVNAVLSGRIVQRGDNLTISAELVDVRYNKVLWGEEYDRKMSDLLQTQREIAREIVEKLKLKVSGEEKGLAKHYTENNEAYQFYLKGRFYWNKRTEEGLNKSLEYYHQAIEKDPNFALAYSGLADTYAILGTPEAGGSMPPNDVMPKAKAAALKALELDETLAEPHVSLAHVKYFYDRDWTTAEREFKRAIELNPNYPTAHHWYAIYLFGAGRQNEALAEIRRAQELDPLSLPINMWLGMILRSSGQLDQAVDQLRKTIDLDPTFVQAHHRLGLAYEEKGSYDDAISEFRQVLKLSGGSPLGIGALAHVYALAGKPAEARKNLDELLQLSRQRYVSPSSIATVYAALGDKDQAFAWLEKANDAHDLLIVRLKWDPRFASLHSDPRFDPLVRRIGSP